METIQQAICENIMKNMTNSRLIINRLHKSDVFSTAVRISAITITHYDVSAMLINAAKMGSIPESD